MNTIGLLFGSFNPVHIGHLMLADFFLHQGACSEVWLVVSPQNPLKSREGLAPESDRLHMTQLAVSGKRRLKVCDIEFSLPRPSYTCLTLEALRRDYPECQFVILMGDDLLEQLPSWKNYSDILAEHTLFVYPRHGIPDTILPEVAVRVKYFDAPRMEVSSTQIRAYLANGIRPEHLVPEEVLAYIEKRNLYQPTTNPDRSRN